LTLNRILAGYGYKGRQDIENEDGLNDLMEYVVAGRMMAKNVNFYAFTATPKNKTLEMFGTPVQKPDGEIGYEPFDLYSMKQAIEEGFILDVTKNYTTYDSFYKILKSTEANPEFDKDQAAKKLRIWVENRPETVEKKARIMVEHFHESICHKIGGGSSRNGGLQWY
jgi:type I restriction enzyme R subunit